jgi:hypothetical protein
MKSGAVSTIKAFAIVGVVFHHIIYPKFDSDVRASLEALPIFFSWCVYAFIGVSGWLHAVSGSKHQRGFGAFIYQRMVRLLLPYVFLVLFYALSWQVIQTVGFMGIGSNQEPSFFGKIYRTIPGVDYEPIAEQLYFLPLLFCIAAVVRLTMELHRRIGPAVGGGVCLVLGMILSPKAGNSGFSVGVWLFGITIYSTGIILYHLRDSSWRFAVAALLSAILLAVLGLSALPKVIPIVVIAVIPELDRLSGQHFNWIGEASGSVFAYHTPLMLKPMLVVTSKLPPHYQIAGAISSAFFSILFCAFLHHKAKASRLKALLM